MTTADATSELSVAVLNLCKGPAYRDTHERVWELVQSLRHQIDDYVGVLGLQVIVDEAEGYAYLRSRPIGEGDTELPRLVARRTVSFHVSVLLALLRKRLAELDGASADTRLVLSRDQLVEMVRVFLPESSNDARVVDQIDVYINKVVEMGFLRRLRGQPDLFEVRRIIKAYVDGQWLGNFDARLDDYLRELRDGERVT